MELPKGGQQFRQERSLIKASEMLVAPRISKCFGLPWSAIVCLGLQYCTFGTFGTVGTFGTFGTFGTDGLDDFDDLEDLDGYLDTCFGLPWSTLICHGLLGLFQITIERLKCSKAICLTDWMDISQTTIAARASLIERC